MIAAVAGDAALIGIVLGMLAALALIRAGVIAWGTASRTADRLADTEPLPGETDCMLPLLDADGDISDAEFDKAQDCLLAAYGHIPPSLQQVIDAGGRFRRAGDHKAGGDFDRWQQEWENQEHP